MKTWQYIIDGLLAGYPVKMLIEQLSQLKADRARSLAKRTGLPLEQLTLIGEIDPTANGSYMEWLAKLAKANQGNLPVEPEAIRTAISGFENVKRLPAFQGNKNILQYRSFDELNDVVNQSHNIMSNVKKEKEVKKLFAEIQRLYPYHDKSGNVLINGGYYPWLLKQAKDGSIILPEDNEKIMDAIGRFENKILDPNFTGSKNIDRYPSLASLIKAVTKGDAATEKSYDRIPDENGIKFIASTNKYGHYYDLYAVTTPEQAVKNFQPVKTELGQHAGWCVRNPSIFTNNYHMGPDNPAYLFRKDGVPYVLSDIRGGHVKDRDDHDVNKTIVMELLALNMPEKLRDMIINKNEWTRKHKELIQTKGIDSAIATLFAKAAGEFEGSSTAAQLAARDAIDFLRTFDWKYPSKEALQYVYTNPWLAMAYAAKNANDWLPDVIPVIEKTPAALAGYYDMAVRKLGLDPAGYPGFKAKAYEWAHKAADRNDYKTGEVPEDIQLYYGPLTMYIKNSGDTDGLTPQLLAKIMKDAPLFGNNIKKSIDQKK
jgi:hypothetical protein